VNFDMTVGGEGNCLVLSSLLLAVISMEEKYGDRVR
jgi:hypothetical protein